MKSSQIKDTILKTGIPLEISVVKKILKYGLEEFGEVEYEREGQLFSTDIHVQKEYKILDNLMIVVNFVVECKYKTRDHIWFFMQFPRGNDYSMRSDARNDVFDELSIPLIRKMGYQIKNEPVFSILRIENFFDVKIVDKGAEIINDKFDPNTIKRALYQAVFGSVKVQKDSIQYILEKLPSDLDLHAVQNFYENEKETFPIISITLPVIVTTARLFRLHEDISLEDIEKQEDIFSLFEEENGLLLMNLNYETVWKFSEELFKKEPLPIYDELKSNEHLNLLHLRNPGYVYIINYEHFDELFSKCLHKIENLCEKFSKNFIR
ncbi:MAG: hypothetical protein WCE94_08025 [Candidatus Methanoperedens sp.]